MTRLRRRTDIDIDIDILVADAGEHVHSLLELADILGDLPVPHFPVIVSVPSCDRGNAVIPQRGCGGPFRCLAIALKIRAKQAD